MAVNLYGDVFLLVNGCMDFFILWLTGTIAKRKICFWRHFVGSFVMAICPLLGIIVPRLHFLYSPLGSVLILSIGIWLAFIPKHCKDFLSLLVTSYIASFTVGGCGMALFYIFGAPPIFGEDVVYRSKLFPIKMLIVLMAVIYVAIKLGVGFVEAQITNQKDYCTAVISFNKKEAVCNAFLDSGNGLKDPFSGYPVIIGTFTILQNFFMKESREKFFSGNLSDNEMQEYLLLHETSLSLRLIPFCSLGQSNGLLLVFRPEAAFLNHLGKEYHLDEVMVGVYMGTFQATYDALASPELFKTVKQVSKPLMKGEYHERL